ncbi:hypothetical protein F5Y17DRAFT_263859 [Xylariaceae sp. FL0594]|nr:hypothetical protein F5Y17DRAFT_263859 [Xylariaceae sp. FL0594]
MDPLSITASVIALLGAANNVYTVLQSFRNADRGLQALVREVVSLKGFLQSIEKALEDCRDHPYALSHIDPALWKESKVALSDCQATLKQLSQVVDAPKKPSRSNTLFRRARVVAELRSRAGDIASYREKISMSNLSLQTLLQVINVSLSLRSNESHDKILRGLQELKDALKKSSQAATLSYSTLFLNEQDMSLVQHLKGLIRAADDFHASASTTASTVVGSTESRIAPSEFEGDHRLSFPACLPSVKLKQIETYLSSNQQNMRPSTSGSDLQKQDTQTIAPQETNANPMPRVADPNQTFSTIFIGGFSKIAQRALQQIDLQQAEALLLEALKWYETSGTKDPSHQRHLQTQLALCNLLQGNRQEAQSLILELVESNTEADTVPHQLLYALALLQLHELDFEGARDNSKRLWEALQETSCTMLGANDAMRLLAASYNESGDTLLAHAIEAEVPGLRLCDPVPGMVDFLVACEELLVKSFGFQGCAPDVNSTSVVQKMQNLPIARNSSSLQLRKQFLSDEAIRPTGSESGITMLDQGLSFKASPDPAGRPLKSKKRSWSHLRTLFRVRITRAASSMDLSALYGNQDGESDTTDECLMNTGQKPCDCSRSKNLKRVKTSHTTRMDSQEACTDHDITDGTSLVAARPSVATREPMATSRASGSDRNIRTEEWIRTQDGIVTESTAPFEHNDVAEQSCALQRQFSFQAGIPDRIPASLSGSLQTNFHELPTTVIFELMDTSSRAQMPTASEALPDDTRPSSNRPCSRTGRRAVTDDITATASNMESEILDLLGQFEPKIRQAGSSETSTAVHKDCDATSQSSGSPKEEQPLHQFLPESPDFVLVKRGESPDTDDKASLKGGSKEIVESANDDSVPNFGDVAQTVVQRSPPSSPESHTDAADPDCMLSPLRIRVSKYGRKSNAKLSRSVKDRTRASQDFTLPLAKLCRRKGLYRLPHRTTATKRLSAIAAVKLRRMFSTDKRGHDFDVGFNLALYSGPAAVIGPFTDLGDTDPIGGEHGSCELVPKNTPIAICS